MERSTTRSLRAVISSSIACSVFLFAASARAFDSTVQGPTVTASFATSHVGDALLFELGWETQGTRTIHSRHWLLQWDVLAALKMGWLGSTHPYLFLLGARLRPWAEAGWRAIDWKWSPYFGARLASDFQIMEHPGLSPAALDTINDVDGVGGLVAKGIARAVLGASYLDDKRSLVVAGFVDESLQPRAVYRDGIALTDYSSNSDYSDFTFKRHQSTEGRHSVRQPPRYPQTAHHRVRQAHQTCRPFPQH